MNVGTKARKGQVTVAVAGEIDMSVQQELLTALSEAARRAAGGRLVVDLSRTSFMDSSGIAALIAGMRAASQSGASYQVTGVMGLVQQILSVTGLLDQLTRENRPA